MAITKNQLRWAEIYIKNEGDRQKLIEGKDPFDLIQEIIEKEFHKIGANGKYRVDHLLSYLKETTVPI